MKTKGSEDKRTVCMLWLFWNSAFPLHDPPGENLVSSSGKYAGQETLFNFRSVVKAVCLTVPICKIPSTSSVGKPGNLQ